MTFDVQKKYDSAMAELQGLVQQINTLGQKMEEMQQEFNQTNTQRQQLTNLALAKQELIRDLQPYVEVRNEESAADTNAETKEAAVLKKNRK